MNTPASILSYLILGIISATSQPASKGGSSITRTSTAAPIYKQESPLPKGWPAPGPFHQVVRKKYPAYRAAFAPGDSPNKSFRKLFKHISRNNIPMTAPVEIALDDSAAMPMEEMAFLYQSPEVGKTGDAGDLVEVRDMPALEVLAYAWQGGRTSSATAKARAAIDAELTKRKLKTSGYRLFGYNSPFVPRSKQTHELQALIR